MSDNPVVSDAHKERFLRVKEGSAQGFASSQCQLGRMYLYGLGCKKSFSLAKKSFEDSARQGHVRAQYYLGCMYDSGLGVEKSAEEAFQWYKKAAKGGHKDAQYNLANCYQTGTGCVQSLRAASEWYLNAALQGDPDSQYNIAKCYLYGYGVPEDDAKAFLWFHKAAKQKHMSAQYRTGTMLLHGVGTETNEKDGTRWLQKAASQGHVEAMHDLGCMYGSGTGVANTDFKKAFKWYRKAAARKHPKAQRKVGYMLKHGYGCQRDILEAYNWYLKAGNNKDSVAQYELGLSHLNGKLGQTKSVSQARYWLKKAADNGSRSAIEKLKTLGRDKRPRRGSIDKANYIERAPLSSSKTRYHPSSGKRGSSRRGTKDGHATPSVKPSAWSISDVGHWLETVGLASIRRLFRQEEITGEALLELNQRDVKRLGLTIGKAKILLKEIEKLKGNITTRTEFVPVRDQDKLDGLEKILQEYGKRATGVKLSIENAVCVVNPRLDRRYQTRRITLREPKSELKFFRPGKHLNNLAQVVADGFDLPKKPDSVGRGIYFEEDAPPESLTPGTGKKVLLCEVGIGKFWEFHKAQNRLDFSEIYELGFDSVFLPKDASPVFSNERWVVFFRDQAIPRYVVTFRVEDTKKGAGMQKSSNRMANKLEALYGPTTPTPAEKSSKYLDVDKKEASIREARSEQVFSKNKHANTEAKRKVREKRRKRGNSVAGLKTPRRGRRKDKPLIRAASEGHVTRNRIQKAA